MTSAAPVVRFDAARHLYFVDGDLKPNVTRMIAALGLIETAFFTKESRDRGIHVHAAVHLWINDNLEDESVYPPWRGHVDAAIRFLEDAKVDRKKLRTEVRVYNPVLGYTGTADVFGPIFDDDDAADWKSGAIGEPTGIQTALYDMAEPRKDGRRRHRYGVQLRPDGTYRLVDLSRNDPTGQDYIHAAALVSLYRRFHWPREKRELLRDAA